MGKKEVDWIRSQATDSQIEGILRQRDKEKSYRIKYQDIVYQLCAIVDTCSTTDIPCVVDEVVNKIKNILTNNK